MHPLTIFTKTAKGILEVKNKTIRLQRELGQVFVAVDGRSSITELERKTDVIKGGLQQALEKLLADGYIKVFYEPPAIGTAAGAPAAVLDDLDFTSPAKVAELTSEADLRAKAEAAAKARAEAAARAAAEAKARQEAESRARAASEAKVKQELAAKIKAEEAARAAAVATVKAQDEVKTATEGNAKAEAEARVRAAMAAKAKADAEAQARAAAESRAKVEAEANAKAEAVARAEAESRAKVEAEARARAAAEARARIAVETKMRAMEGALKEAEARAKTETEARAHAEAEAKAKAEADAKARTEAEARAKAAEEAVAQARALAEAATAATNAAHAAGKSSAESEALAKADQAMHALAEAEARAKAEAEARVAAEAKVAADAERRAQEELLRQAELQVAREEAEAKTRAQMKALEENIRKAREEAQAREEIDRKAREEAEARIATERKAREAAEAQIAAERQSRDELVKKAREEAERKAQAELSTRINAERKAREEAERKAQAAMDASAAAEKLMTEASNKETAEAQRIRAEAQQMLAAARLAHEQAVAKAQSEMAARVQAEKKAAAEKQARAAAEDRAKQESVARVMQEHQAKQRSEQEVQSAVEAELKARQQAEMLAEAKARIESQQRAEEMARIRTLEREESAAAGAGPAPAKKPLKLGSMIAIGAAVFIVLGLAVVELMPLSGYVPGVEKMLSDRLQEPVSVSGMNFSLLPSPQLRIERITIGKAQEVKIDSTVVPVSSLAILDENKDLDEVLLASVNIDQDVIPRFAAWAKAPAGAQRLHINRLKLNNVKLAVRGLDLPTIEGTVTFGKDGSVQEAVLRDPKVSVKLTVNKETGVLNAALTAKNWQPPYGPAVEFSELAGTANISRGQASVTGLEGRLYGGAFKGAITIKWASGVAADGEWSLSGVDISQLLPIFTRGFTASGTLDTSAKFSAQGQTPEDLFAAPRVNATFTLQKGALNNVDIVRAIQAPIRGVQRGGKTTFTEISGEAQTTGNRIAYRNLKLASGPMNATGTLDVGSGADLAGHLNAQVGTGTTIVARGALNVSGSLQDPLLSQ